MSLLHNRDYLLLQTGWAISGLGTQLQAFAFSLYILQGTGSAMQFAVTLCLQLVPMVLLAPFSGYLADRWDRRRQVVLFDLLSAAVALLFWGIFRTAGRLTVGEVYACVCVLAGLQEFTSTTTAGLMQPVVPPEDVTAQKTVGSVVQSLTAVAGPALGGVAYGAMGLGTLLLANFVSFLICAGMESRVRLQPSIRRREAAGRRVRQFFDSQREAMEYVRQSTFLQSFLLIVPAINFIVPGTEVGLMTVAQNRFRIGSGGMGAAGAALAVGMGVGALLAGPAGSRSVERMGLDGMIRRMTGWIALAFVGGGVLLFAGGRLFPPRTVFWLLVLLSAAAAGCCGIVSVHISAAFQKKVDPSIIGRTSALTGAVSVSTAPLGQVAAGALLSVLPAGALYLAEGALSALTVLFAGKIGRNAAHSGTIKKDAARRCRTKGGAPLYREEYDGQTDPSHSGCH